MKPPKIIIIGEPKSGKTYLSAIIEHALKERGFTVEVIEENGTPENETIGQMEKNVRDSVIKNDIQNFLYTKDEPITIEVHKTISAKEK